MVFFRVQSRDSRFFGLMLLVQFVINKFQSQNILNLVSVTFGAEILNRIEEYSHISTTLLYANRLEVGGSEFELRIRADLWTRIHTKASTLPCIEKRLRPF